MRVKRNFRLRAVLIGTAWVTAATLPNADAAPKDIEALKGRIKSQLDGNGGSVASRNEPRINVVEKHPGFSSYSSFSTSYLNGIRSMPDIGGGARGAFLANKSDKAQETEDMQDDCGATAGNPVVLYTGNKVEPELDFASNGEMPLYLQRTYNHHWSATGLFGRHWISNFDYSLVYSEAQNILWAQRPDGRRIKFLLDPASGRWYEDKAQPVAFITRAADGSLTLSNEDRGTETYSPEGFITRRANEQGVAWVFSYNDRYLQTVTHSSGREIGFRWSGGKLTEVSDPAGNTYRYSYQADAFGPGTSRLMSASLPGSPTTVLTYHYEDSRFPGALTGKSFNGVRYSTFAYDAERRATLTEHAGNVERYTFSYAVKSTEPVTPPPAPVVPGKAMTGGTEPEQPWCEPRPGGEICYVPRSLPEMPFSDNSNQSSGMTASSGSEVKTRERAVKIEVTTTNPLGRRTTTSFEDGKQISVAGDATARCPASFKAATYDANGNPDLVHDFADNLTNYDYSPKGFLLRRVEASGTSAARTTDWEWDDTTNRISKITVPGDSQSIFTYDARGNVASVTTYNLSPNGVSQQARTLTYTYTYHPNGLTASIRSDGPLAQDDITETYNAHGDLQSVVNGLGHQTTYASYNALGLPGRVTGPNGDVTEFSYDARGRLLTRRDSVGSGWATSSVTYNGSGSVDTATEADGTVTRFSYDAARRVLSSVRPHGDGTFVWTNFTYDSASNVTRREVRHTDFPLGSTVTGSIEGVTHDGIWNWFVNGWACTTGSNGSIDVHAYTTDGVLIGAFTANQPSEVQVASACQANGTAYRFRFPITLAQRQSLGGRSITVYGVSPQGEGLHRALAGSNSHAIPEAPVRGEIYGIGRDAAFNDFVDGWACSTGSSAAIQVDGYAEGGVYLGSVMANIASDPALAGTCQTTSSAYRFNLPITLAHRQQLGGRAVSVYGLSPAGSGHNRALTGSGNHAIRTAPVVGDISGITKDADWNYFLEGWACSVGVAAPISVHVYAGAPAGSGSYVIEGHASLASGPDIANTCQSHGSAYRFRIPLDINARAAHGNKPIYVHGLSPAGGEHRLLDRSGSFTVPAIIRTAENIGFWTAPDNITNGEGTTLNAQIRNTGNVVWHGDTYLAWGFIHLTDSMPLSTPVRPGEVASFSRFISPENPGNGGRYFEYSAQMATSGTAWGPRSTTGVVVHNTLPICTGRLCEDPRAVTPVVEFEAKDGTK